MSEGERGIKSRDGWAASCKLQATSSQKSSCESRSQLGGGDGVAEKSVIVVVVVVVAEARHNSAGGNGAHDGGQLQSLQNRSS